MGHQQIEQGPKIVCSAKFDAPSAQHGLDGLLDGLLCVKADNGNTYAGSAGKQAGGGKVLLGRRDQQLRDGLARKFLSHA